MSNNHENFRLGRIVIYIKREIRPRPFKRSSLIVPLFAWQWDSGRGAVKYFGITVEDNELIWKHYSSWHSVHTHFQRPKLISHHLHRNKWISFVKNKSSLGERVTPKSGYGVFLWLTFLWLQESRPYEEILGTAKGSPLFAPPEFIKHNILIMVIFIQSDVSEVKT